MAAIGNVLTIYLKSVDTADNEIKTNISKGFTINPSATFEQVDTASRAIIALSTDTYSDTILTTDISVNEELQPAPPSPEPEIIITPASIEGVIEFDTSNQDYIYQTLITIRGVESDVTLKSAMIDTTSGDTYYIPTGSIRLTMNINQVSVVWRRKGNPTKPKTISGNIKFWINDFTRTIPYTISYTP